MIAVKTTGRTFSKVRNSSHLLLEEMLTPAPAHGLLLQISLAQTSRVQCNATARFAKFSPLCVLYQQKREREFHLGRLCDACDRTLSVEKDEYLSPLAMRAPNNSASGEKELRRRRSNAPSADRSLSRPLQRSLSLGLAREFATEGGRGGGRGG